MTTYGEDVARIRGELRQQQVNEILDEAEQLQQAHTEAEAYAARLWQEGDRDGAKVQIEYADDLQRQYADCRKRYDRIVPAQRQPAINESDAQCLLAHRDLIENNPINIAKVQQGDQLARQQGLVPGTPQYQEYVLNFQSPGIVGQDGRIIPGSDGPVVPENHQTMLTPDEVCEISGIDAETYNRGVRQLQKLKAEGHYPDRPES